jgi:exosortase
MKWAESEEYSHAFLTLPIIVYMVYQKKHELAITPARFTTVGLAVLIFSAALYYFSLLTEVHTIIALAMYLTVVGTLLYLFGIKALAELLTPLLLFLMLIPFPDQLYIKLTSPLQFKVSQASAAILPLFDIPVFLAGNVITTPAKSFEVVEACSGLRSVITLLTMSVIMGYFLLRTVPAKVLLTVASIPIALLVNLIRVVLIVLVFHSYGLDLYEGTPHTITGLLLFLIGLSGLFALQRILELWEQKSN